MRFGTYTDFFIIRLLKALSVCKYIKTSEREHSMQHFKFNLSQNSVQCHSPTASVLHTLWQTMSDCFKCVSIVFQEVKP